MRYANPAPRSPRRTQPRRRSHRAGSFGAFIGAPCRSALRHDVDVLVAAPRTDRPRWPSTSAGSWPGASRGQRRWADSRGGHDPPPARVSAWKPLERLLVGDRHEGEAAGVPYSRRARGPDAGVIQAGRDRVRDGHLSIVVLEQVAHRGPCSTPTAPRASSRHRALPLAIPAGRPASTRRRWRTRRSAMNGWNNPMALLPAAHAGDDDVGQPAEYAPGA